MAAKQQNSSQKKPRGKGKPFKANNPETGEKDPRINREGRKVPKDLKELYALIDEILAEDIEDARGNKMQKARFVVNKLITSKSPAGQIHILDRRFGKVPQAVTVEGDQDKPIKIVVEYADTDGNQADSS